VEHSTSGSSAKEYGTVARCFVRYSAMIDRDRAIVTGKLSAPELANAYAVAAIIPITMKTQSAMSIFSENSFMNHGAVSCLGTPLTSRLSIAATGNKALHEVQSSVPDSVSPPHDAHCIISNISCRSTTNSNRSPFEGDTRRTGMAVPECEYFIILMKKVRVGRTDEQARMGRGRQSAAVQTVALSWL